MFTVVVLALIFLIAIAALAFSVRIIKQYEKGLVIRLGKYDHTADAGIVFLIPFIDSLIRVDMREALSMCYRSRLSPPIMWLSLWTRLSITRSLIR